MRLLVWARNGSHEVDVTDVNEPSYYEVALTNRQVLVSFVVLLGCILAAFVFGVWAGKEGSDPAAQELAAQPMEPQEMAKLEELDFFSEAEGTAAGPPTASLDKPDLSKLARQPDPTSTLAEDVGSASTVEPATSGVDQSPPPRQTPPPQEPQKSPAARSTPPPPSSQPAKTPAAASTEGFIVQVFSSHDRTQAQKVLDQMQQGGYRAFLSPKKTGGQTMYRVRLGPYATRAPADAAAGDVTRQFKLETWVTAASN